MSSHSASRKPGRLLIWAGTGVAALLAIWNAVVILPVMRALADEDGVTVVAYRRWLVAPNQIVFDVWRLGDEASMAQVDRMLFRTADALANRRYNTIILAARGEARFQLDGDHFQQIGREWPEQNPIYLMRTLAEHVQTMDGKPAFGTWTGGWLGVLGRQMEDHQNLHREWYIEPLLAPEASGPEASGAPIATDAL